MMYHPVTLPFFLGEPVEPKDPYEVLTLHRESDNVCVVRLQGFESDVFWEEIKLTSRFYFKSPRQKIVEAQEKAARVAEKLKWRDMQAKHEYELSIR